MLSFSCHTYSSKAGRRKLLIAITYFIVIFLHSNLGFLYIWYWKDLFGAGQSLKISSWLVSYQTLILLTFAIFSWAIHINKFVGISISSIISLVIKGGWSFKRKASSWCNSGCGGKIKNLEHIVLWEACNSVLAHSILLIMVQEKILGKISRTVFSRRIIQYHQNSPQSHEWNLHWMKNYHKK